MRYCRTAALLLALSTAAASAAQTSCPRKMMTDEGTVHTLSGAKVLRGATAQNAELTPVHGHYDLLSATTPGDRPFDLVCLYGGTTQTRTLPIPQTATSCTVADAGSGTVAACQ